MILGNITRENIIEAIKEIDDNGVPERRKSTRYDLVYEGKQYPPKYIISIAYKYANGEELSPSLFSAGKGINDLLRKRGFKVIKKNENENVFPIKSHSWTIISPSIFVKKMDKSTFLHHGTGIPKEIKEFFKIKDLEKGETRNAFLRHNGINYNARFELDNKASPRARLFWKTDFVKVIEDQLPHWHSYYMENVESPSELPELRFKKSMEQENMYFIDFISPQEINLDIESEIAEEKGLLAEGAIKYYYGKKYERKPENRRRAIEIHGLNCIVCGFDFEKTYGERGEKE